jgi:hypothetical protein
MELEDLICIMAACIYAADKVSCASRARSPQPSARSPQPSARSPQPSMKRAIQEAFDLRQQYAEVERNRP